MDEYDEAVMGAGIKLSVFLDPFLKENGRQLDKLAAMRIIDARQLAEVREYQQAMVEARVARLQAARED